MVQDGAAKEAAVFSAARRCFVVENPRWLVEEIGLNGEGGEETYGCERKG
jgi:hypothetical protein